ncbi:hypothetical protein [Fodinicola feengrottensis]|uniref:hypothetical protein n=1 Tax=Fodinicola feengrottensis TaxID=435914 RepID=UPI0013D5365C|nr:hypothetical protein [Fodinicola feengrottensis]
MTSTDHEPQAAPAALSRRVFLTLGAMGVGAMSLPERAAAALNISPQNLVEVPADKNLSSEFVAALTAPGVSRPG